MVDYLSNYQPLKKDVWQGRIDDPEDRDSFRWHQVVKAIDLSAPADKIIPIFSHCIGLPVAAGRPSAAPGG